MTNQNATTITTNLVADENGNINCSDCYECKERSEGMLFTQELLERHGMLFLSRLQ